MTDGRTWYSPAADELVREARGLVNAMTDTPSVRNVVMAALDEQQRTIERLHSGLEAANAQLTEANALLRQADRLLTSRQ